MTKSRVFLMMLLLLALALPAAAEPAVPYAAIYAADNPIPGIAADVRPAVAQVVSHAVTWSRETGEVRQVLGYGSAVYIDERGYFLTNHHVVEDADEVTLVLLDGTEIEAEVVGMDDGIDIAVIKVDEKIDAKPVPLGDSDALVIGELAIAIGNPVDGAGDVLRSSVTAGIISAVGREDVTAGNFTRSVKVIQTDAAINAGCSGGALLNARGELIGVPTLKYMYSITTLYEGLGFAVPANAIAPVAQQLIETGRVVRPRMGVLVVDIDGPDNPLKSYPPAGVQVVEVEMGGPAFEAGILNLDIITHVNGKRISAVTQLTGAIDDQPAGEPLTLSICRFFDPVSGEPLAKYDVLDVTIVPEIID